MEIVMFKDAEKGEISPDHPIVVELEEALTKVQNFRINNPKADFDSVIGFQSPWNGLMFLRNGGDMWKVMLLYRENNFSDWDSSDRDFTTAEVVAIMKAFFEEGNWEKLIGVHRLSFIRKFWFNIIALYHSRRIGDEMKI